MCHIIVCDGDDGEREHLIRLVHLCFEGKKRAAKVTGCANWQELEGMSRRTLPDIAIVAQNGVDGLNTITSARLLNGKMIWFSDLDFGAQAYRLCIPYFCQKPISQKKMELALARFVE